MKKSVLRLIPAFIFAALSFEAAAQNVQLHYDLGRKAPTTTVEMFRADGAGSTFFFVDLDYNPRVSGCLSMAFLGKLPFGLAPGMGLNAFFLSPLLQSLSRGSSSYRDIEA